MTDTMDAAEYLATIAKEEKKPSKYNNVRVERHGRKFDSIKEADRYDELLLLQEQGRISDLECQPRFALFVNDEKVGTYVGDFQYHDNDEMAYVVEDVKGVRTDVYKLKRKLMKAVYNIDIREV